MGQLISKFLRHVLPAVIRLLHALWNEVIGFLFIVFTVVAAFYVIRAVRNFEGDIEGLVHIVISTPQPVFRGVSQAPVC